MYRKPLELTQCIEYLRERAKEIKDFRKKLDPNSIYNGYLEIAAIRTTMNVLGVTIERATEAVNLYVKEG